MDIKIYIDKQNNDNRNDFRLRFVDLDCNWSIDKSVGFRDEKTAIRVKEFIDKLMNHISSNSSI